MEAARKRNIQSGERYTHLFPKAEGGYKTIRSNADVGHTVAFIPKVVHQTLDHTRKLAAILKGTTPNESCSNLWHFVYRHIAYRKDQEGYEQIRSPARTWHDRKAGVDCDCYSVFISSVLTNMGIPHLLRITKYHRDYFQHIYPVVVLQGREVPIDCVTDQFDFEVPYTQKKDYKMDLQYLNGFDDSPFGDLGRVRRRGATAPAPSLLQKMKKRKKAAPQGGKPKKKGFFKKVLNKINKINPATVLLRNGILAAMKLNVKNVAARLRWSYLSPEGAAQKGIDPAKFQRLVATRGKLEKIFFGAGGNPKNLRKAILGGKGNKDRAVAGLDGFEDMSGIDYLNVNTPLSQLLGPEVYHSENVEGFEGLGQLGEPITLASVGAAMGVISGIVASLRQIGDIFKKKGQGSKDFDPGTNEAAENNQPVADSTPIPEAAAQKAAQEALPEGMPALPTSSGGGPAPMPYALPQSSEASYPSPAPASPMLPAAPPEEPEMSNTPAVSSGAAAIVPPADTTPPEKQTYWDKNKAWLKPVVFGVGGAALIAVGFALMKPHEANAATPRARRSLDGLPARRNHKRKPKGGGKSKNAKPKRGKHSKKKTAVALL